jgi:hypothetical protein
MRRLLCKPRQSAIQEHLHITGMKKINKKYFNYVTYYSQRRLVSSFNYLINYTKEQAPARTVALLLHSCRPHSVKATVTVENIV